MRALTRRGLQLALLAVLAGPSVAAADYTTATCADFLAMDTRNAPSKRRRRNRDGEEISSPEELEKIIVELEEEMLAASEELQFEHAARIRDELKELRRDLEGLRS